MINAKRLEELRKELDSEVLSCADWCFTRGVELLGTLEAALAVVEAAKEFREVTHCENGCAKDDMSCATNRLDKALAPFEKTDE